MSMSDGFSGGITCCGRRLLCSSGLVYTCVQEMNAFGTDRLRSTSSMAAKCFPMLAAVASHVTWPWLCCRATSAPVICRAERTKCRHLRQTLQYGPTPPQLRSINPSGCKCTISCFALQARGHCWIRTTVDREVFYSVA